MNNLPERILEYTEAKPEATPIPAKSLPHLGDRAALARTLSRLARSDRFLRICRGVHMRPIEIRFDIRTPNLASAVTALGGRRSATIVSNGRGVANWQDLTTENAVRTTYVPPGSLPTPAFRGTPGQTARCSALAIGDPTWNRWDRHPGDFMAGLRQGERTPDAVLPEFALGPRSLSTPDSSTPSADPPRE